MEHCQIKSTRQVFKTTFRRRVPLEGCCLPHGIVRWYNKVPWCNISIGKSHSAFFWLPFSAFSISRISISKFSPSCMLELSIKTIMVENCVDNEFFHRFVSSYLGPSSRFSMDQGDVYRSIHWNKLETIWKQNGLYCQYAYMHTRFSSYTNVQKHW